MPSCCLPGGHGEWRTTFSLHAFVAGALHFAYMIMAAEKQHKINQLAHQQAVPVTDSQLPSLTITAIIFAAIASILCFVLAMAFQKDK